MQKQFFGFIFSLVVLSFLFAFSPAYNSINWKQTSIEFGKIQKGKPVTASYEFVNTGKKPVMIQSAKGSCGCTGVEYSKEAIPAGQASSIKATFNAAKVGAFNKTVTVMVAGDEKPIVLRFNGEVVE
ncbi:DUF1573 domain-containing protein [Bernardetia sp.]|uniref:DUF1573 domain-containing protein n=1 Tax=Bernardetia sp. TaxID=1937974 RepID=UPI0025BBF6C9|nr:DUF1573 domain-containing protein [Bernardetia sp.]